MVPLTYEGCRLHTLYEKQKLALKKKTLAPQHLTILHLDRLSWPPTTVVLKLNIYSKLKVFKVLI